MWLWILEKAKFPRFVWVVLCVALLSLAACVCYRVATDENVLIKVSDKLEIATKVHEQAIERRKEAELFLEEMHKRFDQLHDDLEALKARSSAEAAKRINAAQMELRTFKAGTRVRGLRSPEEK